MIKIGSKNIWFIVGVSLILSIFVLSFYPFYLNPLFKQEIISEAQQDSITFSRFFISKYLPKDSVITNTQQFIQHEKSIQKDIKIFNLWKIRFFNPDGVIIFSSIENEINTKNQKSYFINKVAKGQVISKMEKKGGRTFSEDAVVPFDVVETYVPIMQDQIFNGAIEIYLNVNDQMQRLKYLFWKSYIQIITIVLTLTTIIIVFLLKINKSAQGREKLILKLQSTLEEVKTLQGFLPICANCKKIRDDKGYWNQIEGYIQTHSEAKFSHGMCPECSNELYGKEDWYLEMKNKKKKKE